MEIFLIIGYLACSVLSYGMSMGYFQREFAEIAKETYHNDMAFSALFALFGPVNLVVALIMTGFGKHGLLFTNPHKEVN